MFAFQFPVSCLYRISHSVCQFIEKLSESCYEFDNDLQSERYVVRMFVRKLIKKGRRLGEGHVYNFKKSEGSSIYIRSLGEGHTLNRNFV